jgi:hypothetical protein
MGGNLSQDRPPAAHGSPAPPWSPASWPPAQQPQARPPHGYQPQAGRPPAGPEGQSLGLDPAVWSVIRQSAGWLSRDEGTFIQHLYRNLGGALPEPAGAGAPDLGVFCERMARSLLWVALADQPLGVVADVLRRTGGQNWAEGFPDALYGSFARAVVQTVHYLCDWSTSAGSAWISYFLWIKPHLLAGAQQAATEYASARQETEQKAAERLAAAEREAERVAALSRDSRGGRSQAVGDVNLESVASLLEDEDDENLGYGQIMIAMTRNSRGKGGAPRDPRR